ncbi:hypothetical protein ABID23_000937 [Bartonella silvatica]|uniref:Lipoprotein n=1 Tax=Bartonella silvatica TaxID=357760 RepID=A0ABV2HH40_9HYPH
MGTGKVIAVGVLALNACFSDTQKKASVCAFVMKTIFKSILQSRMDALAVALSRTHEI